MKKSKWEYTRIHNEDAWMVVVAYARFTKSRPELNQIGVLDQILAIAAGWV